MQVDFAPDRIAPRKARRDPANHLLGALHALGDGQAIVLRHEERAWASITFSGARHAVVLRFAGDLAVAAGERFIAALPDHVRKCHAIAGRTKPRRAKTARRFGSGFAPDFAAPTEARDLFFALATARNDVWVFDDLDRDLAFFGVFTQRLQEVSDTFFDIGRFLRFFPAQFEAHPVFVIDAQIAACPCAAKFAGVPTLGHLRGVALPAERAARLAKKRQG